jgi:hypothetical protein
MNTYSNRKNVYILEPNRREARIQARELTEYLRLLYYKHSEIFNPLVMPVPKSLEWRLKFTIRGLAIRECETCKAHSKITYFHKTPAFGMIELCPTCHAKRNAYINPKKVKK